MSTIEQLQQQFGLPPKKNEEEEFQIADFPLVERLKKQKEVAFRFQERKHRHWRENYLLFRDFVELNRLTQRQAVNIPIMKETLKTWLSKVDEVPDIVFEAIGQDEEAKKKEIIINEYWKYYFDKCNLEILDKLEKKIVFLQGRGIKKLNFLNDEFVCDIIDPYDFLIDPLTLPYDIETARYIIHTHIFRTLKEILADDKYDEEAKEQLKKFLFSKEGMLIQKQVLNSLEAKQERLRQLGAPQIESFSAGDVVVELNEFYTNLWDEEKQKWVRYLIVLAVDNIILLKKPLKEVLGVEFYPFVSWTDDLDLNDFWSDSLADMIRVPNKILNIWFSQLLENRTFRNFGMMFYNSSLITPITFEPRPFGMYGIPVPEGRSLSEMFQYIQIPPLSDTINEMEYITRMIEKATGVVAIEKGVSEKKQITLGEVQILARKAAERGYEVAKNYRRAWKEFAEKWYLIMKENKTSKAIKIFKKSFKGNWWEKEIKPSDWINEKGYVVIIRSSSEQEEDKMMALQRLIAIRNQFPDNKALARIIAKRFLEIGNFTYEEMKEILEEEKKKTEQSEQAPSMPSPKGMPIEELDKILKAQSNILTPEQYVG